MNSCTKLVKIPLQMIMEKGFLKRKLNLYNIILSTYRVFTNPLYVKMLSFTVNITLWKFGVFFRESSLKGKLILICDMPRLHKYDASYITNKYLELNYDRA